MGTKKEKGQEAICLLGISLKVMEYIRFHPTLFSKLVDSYANEEASSQAARSRILGCVLHQEFLQFLLILSKNSFERLKRCEMLEAQVFLLVSSLTNRPLSSLALFCDHSFAMGNLQLGRLERLHMAAVQGVSVRMESTVSGLKSIYLEPADPCLIEKTLII